MKIKTVLVGLSLLLFTGSLAQADTILKFDLDEVGPDILFENGVLHTADDGDASTPGNQNTNLEYTGFLDGLFPDIVFGASFTLASVQATGAATQAGPLVLQSTAGGVVSIYDENDVLLLEGSLAEGQIAGSTTGSTGSFFTTTSVSYTGGSLLNFVLPNSGALSLAFASILSGTESGLRANGGTLSNFSANATGLAEGEVPEPASLGLLACGLLGGLIRRRKA